MFNYRTKCQYYDSCYCFNVCIGGEDYRSQRYDTVRFVKGRSRYVELKTEFIKDDIVEDDEYYYLKIVPDTLPDRVIVGNPNYTKVVIQNDDGNYKYCNDDKFTYFPILLLCNNEPHNQNHHPWIYIRASTKI